MVKAKGRLAHLAELTDGGKSLHGSVASVTPAGPPTGAPSDENSHPHAADQGKIVVVHNGIIENYQKLKEMLQANGKRFHSETDTEVVANLVEYFL